MTPKNKSNMSEQIEKDKIYNCDCLEDEVSPDNTGETTDGKGKEAGISEVGKAGFSPAFVM